MHLGSAEAEMFKNFSSFRQMKFISVIVPPMVLIIGSFGNIMVPIVLYKHSKAISTYIYLISLAVADQICLLAGITLNWLNHMFGIQLDTISNKSCKLVSFIGTTSSHVAVWLIVVVTVERMIVVSMPFKVPQHITVSRARFCVFSVIVSFLVINSHFFFTISLMIHSQDTVSNITSNISYPDSVYKLCDFKNYVGFPMAIIWTWFDAIVYSYFPCLIIIVANVVIIHFLRNAHKRRLLMQCNTSTFNCQSTPTNHSKQTNYQFKSSNQSSQQLLMLILVSWVFVLTVLPVSICKIVVAIIKKQYPLFFENQQTNAQFRLIIAIVEILMSTNHSINFFLYCIAGKKFRNYFLSLWSCSRHSNTNASTVVGASMYVNSNCSRKFVKRPVDVHSEHHPIIKSDHCREVLIEYCTEL